MLTKLLSKTTSGAHCSGTHPGPYLGTDERAFAQDVAQYKQIKI